MELKAEDVKEEVHEEVGEENTDELNQETPEEPWMKVEDGEAEQPAEESSNQVPVGKLVSVKKKLRGQISERDEEIERLRKENEALKNNPSSGPKLTRPKASDFDSDDDFNDAMDAYYDQRAIETVTRANKQASQTQTIEQAAKKQKENVDQHYERAEKLVETAGIKPEIYKSADEKVRRAVDLIMPKAGDMVVDQIISNLGEGSEKVMYYLGRNDKALAKFQSLLASDKTGLQAAMYLGQEKQRLTNPTKPRSKAPKPAPHANGDLSGESGAALKSKYDAAHKKKDTQTAFNIKREAKKSGVDTSKW